MESRDLFLKWPGFLIWRSRGLLDLPGSGGRSMSLPVRLTDPWIGNLPRAEYFESRPLKPMDCRVDRTLSPKVSTASKPPPMASQQRNENVIPMFGIRWSNFLPRMQNVLGFRDRRILCKKKKRGVKISEL